MSSIITGLKDFYWAKMTKDDTTAVYDVPVRIYDLRGADVSPLIESVDVEADDNTETFYGGNGANVTLEFKNLKSSEYAMIGGLRKTANGIVASGGKVEPPAGACGYRRTMTSKDGEFDRYVWLLKTKLTEQQEAATTKAAGALNPQYPTLAGRAENRVCDDQWKIFIDSNDPEFTAAIGENWFSKATLEVLYNTAAAVNGIPAEIAWSKPPTGKAGVVYIDTVTGKAEYWDGTKYVLLGEKA